MTCGSHSSPRIFEADSVRYNMIAILYEPELINFSLELSLGLFNDSLFPEFGPYVEPLVATIHVTIGLIILDTHAPRLSICTDIHFDRIGFSL